MRRLSNLTGDKLPTLDRTIDFVQNSAGRGVQRFNLAQTRVVDTTAISLMLQPLALSDEPVAIYLPNFTEARLPEPFHSEWAGLDARAVTLARIPDFAPIAVIRRANSSKVFQQVRRYCKRLKAQLPNVPPSLLDDCRMLISNMCSLAFIERSARKAYICAGVTAGPHPEIQVTITELSDIRHATDDPVQIANLISERLNNGGESGISEPVLRLVFDLGGWIGLAENRSAAYNSSSASSSRETSAGVLRTPLVRGIRLTQFSAPLTIIK